MSKGVNVATREPYKSLEEIKKASGCKGTGKGDSKKPADSILIIKNFK